MRRYDLYSDASLDDARKFGTWAFICLDQERIYSQDIGSGRYANNFQSEIAGLTAGLESLPDKAVVVSHSDIRAFESIYAMGNRSKHACIRKLVALVRDKELEFTNVFERIRQNRSLFYHLCDQRANLHLRALVGRGGKTLF